MALPTIQTILSAATSGPTTRSATVTLPAGLATGQAMLAIGVARQGSGVTFTWPAGWQTPAANSSASRNPGANPGLLMALRYRYAQAGDAGSTLTLTWNDDAALTNDGDGGLALIVFNAGTVDPTSMVNAIATWTNQNGSTGHVVPTTTSTVDQGLVINLLGFVGNTTVTDPAGVTRQLQLNDGDTAAVGARFTMEVATDDAAQGAGTTTAHTFTTGSTVAALMTQIVIAGSVSGGGGTAVEVFETPIYGTQHTVGFWALDGTTRQPLAGVTFNSGLTSGAGKLLLSLDMANPVNSTNSVVEVGSGFYTLALTASETQHNRVDAFARITAGGTNPYTVGLETIYPRQFPVAQSGTARGGTASTITLAASASVSSDRYLNHYIKLTSGTGAGQRRKITAYVGSSQVATVGTPWTTIPDATSVYQVLDPGEAQAIITHGDDPINGWTGTDAPTADEIAQANWEYADRGLTNRRREIAETSEACNDRDGWCRKETAVSNVKCRSRCDRSRELRKRSTRGTRERGISKRRITGAVRSHDDMTGRDRPEGAIAPYGATEPEGRQRPRRERRASVRVSSWPPRPETRCPPEDADDRPR